jgi:hypothetical protein
VLLGPPQQRSQDERTQRTAVLAHSGRIRLTDRFGVGDEFEDDRYRRFPSTTTPTGVVMTLPFVVAVPMVTTSEVWSRSSSSMADSPKA